METLYRETADSKYRPAVLLGRMVDAGWYGKKSGKVRRRLSCAINSAHLELVSLATPTGLLRVSRSAVAPLDAR